ncbi:MAG: phosphoribosylglycinamide formyltransferase [Alphaproteobacteria bacterium]|nr:phosphoribosylglycinamide formyltransferase [Alphaproteobacteria bacterium]MBU0797844.1 phosphoribosylglycinamide formyltransferase [Alphaproteobacteria bacterium]MBU0886709.1 phosphoribosylglycinamide formyltransferase [Alphaproteobacteria bacterium]MBU1814564.1 phosphoribosylglycinamide formyltransferase [Alphaproteobacteria bacterium]
MERLKVAVLISGRGSNLQSLIDACAAPDFPAEIVLVLSNKADAYGLVRAAEAGIATTAISHKAYPDRESFDEALHAEIVAAGAQLVCLAGFMRLLTPGFVGKWHDRMINIHPSLLPAFKGLHSHERAIEAGCRFTGCTVHFVRAEMDDGPIIVQAAVPILPGDSANELSDRVLAAEHRCYPLALRLVAEGKAVVDGAIVRIADAASPQDALLNPLAG